MSEIYKPDLVVHPLYSKTINRFDLNRYYNIINLADLMYSAQFVTPYLVQDHGVIVMNDVTLSPVFRESMSKRSGIKPHYTSYTFDQIIPIYSLPYRAPRYIIWNHEDDLTICGTCVDRVNSCDLYNAYQRARDWSYSITERESIIVFDLDETLIDKQCRKLKGVDRLLDCSRAIYDKVVLYSHGSSLHVDENVEKFKDNIFDLILSNSSENKVCNKNLLSLYNYFPNTIFTKATLVDDSLYNWTPEYTKFIVPFQLSCVDNILPLIN